MAYQTISRIDGSELHTKLTFANLQDVARACQAADECFSDYRATTGVTRAGFLRTIAANLESDRAQLVTIAMHESGLPDARLNGELSRTTAQLELFAKIIESNQWLDTRFDYADPNRTPIPKPDTRSMNRPLGPVAVFGASNFPFAFSTAGGDTASALAAGCPVIVKNHPSHPGTGNLVANAVQNAVTRSGMPNGVFHALLSDDPGVAQSLVRNPNIQAVGFTGSRHVGLLLNKIATERDVPIPFFAEMSSVNPLVVLPGVDHAKFADGFVASLTLGVGQFCTNPGLVFVVEAKPELEKLIAEKLSNVTTGKMLSESIEANYSQCCTALSLASESIFEGSHSVSSPRLYAIAASQFLQSNLYQQEVFGPCALIVRCATEAEMIACLKTLEGNLTCSIHAGARDQETVRKIVPILERKAGRLIYNGFPTGLEVNSSMVHSGPYPATTNAQYTAVGSRAIFRWVRPVCFQDFVSEFLPAELRD